MFGIRDGVREEGGGDKTAGRVHRMIGAGVRGLE
jgi:hypothetical protein